ncbi:unnamed protein product [Discula destructiva]
MAPSKTISKTSTPKSNMRRSAPKSASSKTPQKRESVTNKSILNFFHKVDRPEESMFVDAGAKPAPAPPANSLPLDEDDIYGAGGPVLEQRCSEPRRLSRKRSLSAASQEENSTAPTPHKSDKETPQPAPLKKPRKGPFLNDSDSEEDDGDIAPTSSVTGPDPASEHVEPLPKEKEVRPTILSPPSTTMEPSRTSLTPAPDAASASASASETVPRPLKPEPSVSDDADVDEFQDLDDDIDHDLFADFEGEELREMRYIKEQARLDTQEMGDQGHYSCYDDDGFETLMEDSGMIESCPICNSSLAGITSDQAAVHVNSCLDSSPTTPLPTKAPPSAAMSNQPDEAARCLVRTETLHENKDLVSAPDVGKRFARAAVARPGQASPFSLGGEGSSTRNPDATSAFSKLMSGHAEDAAWATAAAAETSARGKPAYERTCPFYKIMPGFNICVDAFRYGAVKGCQAYFLSHFHSDHYIGLTASWTHGPIYCSKVTGSLVKTQLKTAAKYVVELDFEEKVPVPGTEGVFVTMIPANHCPGSSLFLFEKAVSNPNPHANIKEKRTQRILHCGDFRACPAHTEHPQLRPETTDALGRIKQQKIDICYLDTTYLNPRYSFPPQTDVIRAAADLCLELDTGLRAENESQWNSVLRRREGRGAGANGDVSRFFVTADKTTTDTVPLASGSDAPSNPNALTVLGAKARANRNRLLVVCGTYSIGKERICKAIAIALKTKIYASPAKIRICSQLGDPELTSLMTNNPHEAQVHMQMLMELRAETLAEYLDHHKPHFGRVIGLRPSGWSYRPTMANNGSGATTPVTANMAPSSVAMTQILHGPSWRTRFGPRDLIPQQGSSRDAMCFGVPYSEHSSFRELMLFVMGLRIEKIVPTVNVGSEPSRRRMKSWTDRWLGERRRGGVVRVLKGTHDEIGDKGDGGQPKGKSEIAMWDGKDGIGGAVHW